MTEPHSNLVTIQTLYRNLDDPDWVIVDCRFNLLDPEAGRQAFEAGHIPGAVYADLDKDLAGPVTPDTGRHPLPDADALGERLGQWGIGPSTRVVAYDSGDGAIAARLWWLLRWLGHERAALLDQGLRGWETVGLPLATSRDARPPRAFPARPRPEAWVDTKSLAAGLEQETLLVDARTAARFRGEVEPIDALAGHVPGAVNHPFGRNLDADSSFLPPAELRRRWLEVLGTKQPRDTVCMCGSGVTACHNLLAMELAGLEGARLYAGSWSEWIRDPARPVAVGP